MGFKVSNFIFSTIFVIFRQKIAKAFVVTDKADITTILGSLSLVMIYATACMRSGLPTEAPPNFSTYITQKPSILIAVIAASSPLLPYLPPALSSACFWVLEVSTPKITGLLYFKETFVIP